MLVKKCFLLRHQAAGVLTDRVFLEVPTEADIAAARARLEPVYGTHHPKGKPYWITVEETCLLVPDVFSLSSMEPAELPEDRADKLKAGARPDGAQAGAAVDLVTTKVEGRVINPGDPDHPGT